MDSKRLQRRALIVIFLVGALARLTFVGEPFGPAAINAWREADYVQIARNFARDDLNILHPRVDWRIDGQRDASGLVEMEFPFLPWLAAVLYRSVGDHEAGFRALSALCSIAALFVFFRIAQRLLAPPGALAATALFAANPLLVTLSGSLQPDGVMLLLGLLAVEALLAWQARGNPFALGVAGSWLGLAILAKTPAVHLAFLFAFVVLRQLGARAWRSGSVYASSCMAIVPALLWYLYAREIWQTTGLSLGLSNETHFLNLEVLWHAWAPIVGNLRSELRHVVSGPGLVLLFVMLWQPLHKVVIPLVWYATTWIFYAVALETSGDDWAYYYHAIGVAPACLLLGAGVMTFLDPENVYRVATRSTEKAARTAALVMLNIVLAVFVYRTHGLLHFRTHQADLHSLYDGLHGVDALLPENAMLVIQGGPSRDEHGHPVAYNASMAFAWLDRKGFNYPSDHFAFEQLTEFAERGATHWIVREHELEARAMRAEALQRYPLLTQKGDVLILKLHDTE